MRTFNLDAPLMDLSGGQQCVQYWTGRNAVEGVQIFGGIGSGKTSGSGRFLAMKYLNAGFGGLVLTVKPDEKELWQQYCAEAGRLDDLIIVGPEDENYFNFLAYESASGQATDNIVQVLKTVIRASQQKAQGGSNDSFWEDSLDMLMANVIDLCRLAYGLVSVEKIYNLVQTAPKLELGDNFEQTAFFEAFTAARQNVQREIKEWQEKPENKRCTNRYMRYLPNARSMVHIDQFFFGTYMNLSEKTRSIVDFSFSGFLFQLLREPVFSLFCQRRSTILPDDCLNGKIILIDLPIKVYHKVGRDCQILFKFIWQRAMEKRTVDDNTLPVFLWADEAQHFLHEHDAECQATARSSRIATVYISQNLPNYLASMGGARPDEKVKSFLGTLGTKIFHANVDVDTNRYASETIGDTNYNDTSVNTSTSGQYSASRSQSLRIDKVYRPEFFARLKTGSPKNKYKIEAVMLVQGLLMEDDKIHKLIHFTQKQIINN